ncbi:putative arginyl-tRNA--protein transferase [Kordiimonas sediminis]|uniref:Aspartate/glutamate leucyltransferase n=1 Tax=Kordiimonas sediminis TaxID=1735581 RepID=A0A919ATI1_9PROT|nr:arginyltransferase [Kordiimonas sediminis]GHF26328.1 putative arginyl-tRNA--protein transferase [Kordiimonas sediminis]
MTDQGLQFPKFFVTAPSPCPYLPDRVERKVFTELRGPDAPGLNEALGRVGFRRSQSVIYRPACETCVSCVSVRVKAQEFSPSKSMRRILRRNRDIKAEMIPPLAKQEHYDLLSQYLNSRHGEGSMADMTFEEYQEMIESSPVPTVLIEYRKVLDNSLLAIALTDELSDGLSMVYSFFDTSEPDRSLGTYIILDHIERVRIENHPYVYLGYWVDGSPKMAYKNRFAPLEYLGPDGWHEKTTITADNSPS